MAAALLPRDVYVVSTRYRIGAGFRAVALPANAILIRHAVRNIIAVGPHTENRKIRRNEDLDPRALGEFHFFPVA